MRRMHHLGNADMFHLLAYIFFFLGKKTTKLLGHVDEINIRWNYNTEGL